MKVYVWVVCVAAVVLGTAGCQKKAQTQQAMQAMPVKVQTVALKPVPDFSEYLATLQSRNSSVLQPEVEGQITKIFVTSGTHVEPGTPIMEIDPRRQEATVNQQEATQAQKQATYEFNKLQMERYKKLFEAGVVSRQDYDNALTQYNASKADIEATQAVIRQQRVQLHYFTVRAPAAGVIGDIPVRVGDRVTNTTVLTTLDRGGQLEAYINIPAERSTDVKMGTPVELLDDTGNAIATTKVYFVSPRVDTANQLLLVKAPVPNSDQRFRNEQVLHARVIWTQVPRPTIPVLSISRIGGQSFAFVAVKGPQGSVAQQRAIKIGSLIGNDYVVQEGLHEGDQLIVGGTQNLIDGMPVAPQA